MSRSQQTSGLSLRTWILPILQALLTGGSTGLAVILVALWRPNRSRYIPFYSDATHNDPERIILAIGENLACFLMPLVAVAEYLQQSRLSSFFPRAAVPRTLRWLLPGHRSSSKALAQANFVITAATSLFFFVTANVPSKFPYTPPHQFAASALILMYALQATLKAILAKTFCNYESVGTGVVDVEAAEEGGKVYSDSVGSDKDGEEVAMLEAGARKPAPPPPPSSSQSSGGNLLASLWTRHHMKLRVLLATILWLSLVLTWVCFVGRVASKRRAGWEAFRQGLSVVMAVIVHAATGSCVALMGVMAVDMRGERVTLESRA